MAEAPTVNDDPFDLGDTDLYPKAEVAPSNPPPDGAKPAQVAAPVTPPKDPVTGRFISPTEVPLAKPVHPTWLVKEAARFGFETAEIEDMPTAQLSRNVYLMQQQRDQFSAEQATAKIVADGQVRQPEPGQPKVAVPVEPTDDLGIDWGTDDDGRKLTEADYAKPFVAILKAQQRQIKELREQVGQVRGHLEQRATESRDEFIDRVIRDKCDPAKVGDKSYRDLDANSGEMRKRKFIVQEAAALVGPKGNIRDLTSKIEEVAASLGFGKAAAKPAEPVHAKPAEANGRITEKEWANAGLAMPTERNGAAEPKGEALAVRNLEAKMKAEGISPGAVGDEEIDDTLL